MAGDDMGSEVAEREPQAALAAPAQHLRHSSGARYRIVEVYRRLRRIILHAWRGIILTALRRIILPHTRSRQARSTIRLARAIHCTAIALYKKRHRFVDERIDRRRPLDRQIRERLP